jgi:hypothetical protein
MTKTTSAQVTSWEARPRRALDLRPRARTSKLEELEKIFSAVGLRSSHRLQTNKSRILGARVIAGVKKMDLKVSVAQQSLRLHGEMIPGRSAPRLCVDDESSGAHQLCPHTSKRSRSIERAKADRIHGPTGESAPMKQSSQSLRDKKGPGMLVPGPFVGHAGWGLVCRANRQATLLVTETFLLVNSHRTKSLRRPFFHQATEPPPPPIESLHFWA